ncbi:hypothetical protein PAAG_11484 [Paracoccidioides lutzii Pb01]|uniref:Uncharacterized protein n=1 Tax=Paracoccidioides lutzii (strain ATCC MYA-826 / Pb01) TaxID=502779 RepID=A0A0A2V2R6_PARBA|nr:hypothetical protein PAAG_11484 [Paracoccidioides lutzii Pb01]KGQ01763.1 hypothetical protein PAAG_11484 [Paracoccidioides lutzii Pb01]
MNSLLAATAVDLVLSSNETESATVYSSTAQQQSQRRLPLRARKHQPREPLFALSPRSLSALMQFVLPNIQQTASDRISIIFDLMLGACNIAVFQFQMAKRGTLLIPRRNQL